MIRQEETPAGAGKGRVLSSGPGTPVVADRGAKPPLVGFGKAYIETTTGGGKRQETERTVSRLLVVLMVMLKLHGLERQLSDNMI
jgi:hypothetical protein